MFAIAFDLTVADIYEHHPRGGDRPAQAYDDVGSVMADHGFRRIQGSVFVSDTDDLAKLFDVMTALKSLPWFPKVVRDIRAFRMAHLSDFTPTLKQP